MSLVLAFFKTERLWAAGDDGIPFYLNLPIRMFFPSTGPQTLQPEA